MPGSIKKNYLYNVIYQILVLLTPLIVTPYISRVIGPAGVGEYSFAASIVSYFVLFATLGTTTYGQREISYHQNDRAKRSQIFWELWILILLINIVTLAAYAVFCFYKRWDLLYVVQVFSVIAVSVDVVWLFQGMEDFKDIVIRNIVLKIVGILFIFFFVKDRQDVVLYAFGMAFMNFLANLSLWPLLKKYVDKPEIASLHPFCHLKPSLRLFVPTIAISVYTVLDKTMIGLLAGQGAYMQNGYYEQAMKVPKMLLVLITALGTVMVPRIGYHFEKKEHEIVRDYMYRGYQFVWFLGIPLSFGLFGIAGHFVPWFLGDGFEAAIPILKVLSGLILIIGMSNVTGTQYLIPTKRENIFTRTVLTGAVVNFFMNLILIPKWAAFGAALASVCAELVITVVQLAAVRKELRSCTILAMGRNYLAAGCVMLAVVWAESNILDKTIGGTLVMVVSGAVVYFLCLIVMKDTFLKHVLKR